MGLRVITQYKLFAMIIALIFLFSGCSAHTRVPDEHTDERRGGFSRDISSLDYSGIQFTPWDVDAAAALAGTRQQKDYTVMIYMNGSDLESEGGAATADIAEMLRSGVDTDHTNIVIFTGGTNRWRNSVVPSNECALWRVEGGDIVKLGGVGLHNMGDSGTLAGFIDFSLRCFPAQAYGLILWDHGGGSIAGYGQDEKFGNSRLGLLEMDYAFERAGLAGKKLAFIGFDACLMATAEMAVITADYAGYLIASQDLEPGDGWDYSFLSVLNAPGLDGAEIGRAVADAYMAFYGEFTDEDLTISITDLSKADQVMGAMGRLMGRCADTLVEDGGEVFTSFAVKRHQTKSFGNGSRRDDDCDMVDIGDMARLLSDLFPAEAAELAGALEDAVVYNRHNCDVDLGGLSTFYIFGGKNNADMTLAAYSALGMSREYTDYLYAFAGAMDSKARAYRSDAGMGDILETYLTLWQPIDRANDIYLMAGIRDGYSADYSGSWPRIEGRHVCLYETDRSARGAEYSIPARHNGADCDIIVLFSDGYPGGRILGARKEEGYIIQKGLDEIKDGDVIAFYDTLWDQADAQPGITRAGEAFVVNGRLGLEWVELNEKAEYWGSVLTVDIRQDERYTKLERAG